MLTYGEVKVLLAQWVGRGGACPTSDAVPAFVRQVLEYLLISGTYGSIRKFTFQAVKGMFTIPYELEAIEKVKIDNFVGSVWDKWFEFRSTKDLGCASLPASEALFEDANYYPTVYDVPIGGAYIGVQGTCEEACDAHVIVQGQDMSGREIVTFHQGDQVVGAYLTIRKGQLVTTNIQFGKITGVLKSETKGYVQLYALKDLSNVLCPNKCFLADYSPLETKPAYRRYRLTSPQCGALARVEVLGKIRLKSAYADTDFIPFDNMYTISLAAQAINAQYNNDVQMAAAKDQAMMEQINRENTYKKIQNGQPVEYLQILSPGQIRNIVS